MKRQDKRAIQLAISTLILMIIGIILLIGIISIMFIGWDDFKTAIGAALGSDVSQARKACNLQCSLENDYDFCCEQKDVRRENTITCQDELLVGDCEVDCSLMSC